MNDSKSIFASRVFWLNIVSAAVAILTALLAQDWIAEYPKVFAGLGTALAIANVILRLLTDKAVHIIALFLAFVLPLSTCQAACRHITPMPGHGERINRVMLCSTFSPPLIVDYGGREWPAKNSRKLLGLNGDVATLKFDGYSGNWHIVSVSPRPTNAFEVPVGMRVR